MSSNHFLILFGVWVAVSNAVTAMRNPPDGIYPWFFRFLMGVLQVVQNEASKNPKFAAITQTVERPGSTVTTTAETSTLPAKDTP